MAFNIHSMENGFVREIIPFVIPDPTNPWTPHKHNYDCVKKPNDITIARQNKVDWRKKQLQKQQMQQASKQTIPITVSILFFLFFDFFFTHCKQLRLCAK